VKEKLKILIIEDSQQDFLILKEYINRIDSFTTELVHTESLTVAASLLNHQKFDLIFLDLFLEDSFGRNSFLKLYEIESNTPVIVLSGLADKSIALEIVQLGAQEYIVKGDFDELLIEKAVIYSIERYRFQKKIETSEKRHRLTFQNAGVALGEYDLNELYKFVLELKKKGLKHPSEYKVNTLEQGMHLRGMLTLESINQEALSLFGMESLEDFKENHKEVHSAESIGIFTMIIDALWYEKTSFKIITKYKRRSHEELILLSRGVIFGYEEGNLKLIKSGTDITALVEKENLIARQIELAENLSDSTIQLLGANREARLEKALEIQASAQKVDYLSIVQLENKSNQLFLKSKEKWCKNQEYVSPKNNWLYDTPLEELGLTNSIKTLMDNRQIYVDSIHELQGLELKNILQRSGIKSLLISPVFVKNEFWAAVVYACYEEEKKWKDEELITAKSFAQSVGSYIARNKAELELKTLNEELESRIAHRTEDLTEAVNELESFSYSVSHDLRAPLRKVGGFSQILEKDYGNELPDKAKHLLANIKDGASEMSQLIHDLLEFSKLGRQNISFDLIDLNSICSEIIGDTIHTYPDLNINFKVEELVKPKGDRALLKHVLSNLIWNAVKFSSKNENIEINIRSKTSEGYHHFSIKDNGIGIDMNYAHKIFNVFQRLHTKDQYEGTGVGLAIVKRIIKKHHGSIKVYGEPNKGTTFTFSLPVNPDDEQVLLVDDSLDKATGFLMKQA